MSDERFQAMPFPEQAELATSYEVWRKGERAGVDRREFLRVFGGGVAVLLVAEPTWAQESGREGAAPGDRVDPKNVASWLHVDEAGKITVYTGKVEVGQNVRTSLAQAVADELRCDVGAIEMVMGDTDLVPFDMGTFGSLSTPQMAPQLRRAAATARQMLVDLAAERLGVDDATLETGDGGVHHAASGRTLGFGELARGERLQREISSDVAITPPEEWTRAGQPVAKVNGRSFVTGEHRFTTDHTLPGMGYGKVLRPVSFGASLVEVDTSAAEAMPEVTVVRDGDFVGVVAASESLAAGALEAIRAQWKEVPGPSSAEIYDYIKQHPSQATGFRGPRRREEGSLEEGLAAAVHRLEETYTVAHIAHAPLEPRAALAQWKDGRLEVWTGTQRPFGVRTELAEAFGLPVEKVHVRMPDTGSGYGGKHTGECAIEAARLARGAKRPVKLVWTREEEFTWAYFRPAGVIEMKGGVDAEGRVIAWQLHNFNSGASAIDDRYDVPNRLVAYSPAEVPIRVGSYRGLAATANHFARESHLDDLAHAAGRDPLAFRLANTKDDRLRAVLEAAAERFGWADRKPAKDRGFGIAAGFEKAAYVASCVELTIDRAAGRVDIERIVTAFDCGAIVNPDGLRNQVEGSVMQGLGGALFEAVRFADGKVENPRFARYRVPRFSDLPRLETILIDRKDVPSAGAGETGIVAVAPAVGNAIFDACGKRLRSLPMIPDGLELS